jgi:hypothetical protein
VDTEEAQPPSAGHPVRSPLALTALALTSAVAPGSNRNDQGLIPVRLPRLLTLIGRLILARHGDTRNDR